MTLVIALLAVGIAVIDPSALIWLMPVGLPLLLAIPLTVLTSQIALGTTLRDRGFLLIPEEIPLAGRAAPRLDARRAPGPPGRPGHRLRRHASLKEAERR
jgi:membrane glycosyltransferase